MDKNIFNSRIYITRVFLIHIPFNLDITSMSVIVNIGNLLSNTIQQN